MVVYLTRLLLEGKGDLERVWLAAHWHKKLKRSQVAQVDIVGSVRDMMQREIVLDLRLSGHLLVGIVRIHSRKTQLLLLECSDIFQRVRLFREVVTELPPSRLQARLSDITLADPTLDPHTFGGVDDDAVFLLNQSRIEEITLKETVGNPRLLKDDFDEMNFEENNVGAMFEDDLHISLFNEEPPARKVSEQSVRNFEDGQKSPNSDIEMECNIPAENGSSKDSCSSGGRHASTSQELIFVEDEIPKHRHELISLQPLAGDALSNGRRGRQGRKRRLIVDAVKELGRGEQWCTTAPLDMAPPSKRLMLLKEVGGASGILLRPAYTTSSHTILGLFTRNLKTRKCEDVEESSWEEDSNHSFPSIEIPRQEILSHSSADELLDVNENFAEGMEGDEVQLDIESSNPHAQNMEYSEINFSNEIQFDMSACEKSKESAVATQDKVVSLLECVRGRLAGGDRLPFSEMLRGDRRGTVARKFFSLLVLKKFCIVDVHQQDCFNEILITQGDNFDTACHELCPN